MSQKVSPKLFNNLLYNNSKKINKNSNKFSLNEDLQIREIINIIFKNNVNFQYLFIDNIIIYKYYSKINIFVYFFCNFKYLKKNIIENNNLFLKDKQYINFIYIYFKYLEILNIKKIEIIKLLYSLKYNNSNIYLYFKNIKSIYNNVSFFENRSNIKKYKYLYKYKFLKVNLYNNYFSYKKNNNIYINNNNKYNFKRKRTKLQRYFNNLKYLKSMHFILYNLCFNDRFLNKLTILSLIKIIYFELDYVNNASKNYNFLFYNIFNLMREYLIKYLLNPNCNLKGIRIKIKGRFFLTKRKRVFIFNMGELNLNRIDKIKDYQCFHLIKSTGASSIKIWVNYK